MDTPQQVNENVVVGKYYLVDCAVVWSSRTKREEIIPVIGPIHVDKDFFTRKHLHIDGRFVNQEKSRLIDYFVDGLTANIVYVGEDGLDLKYISSTQKKLKCIRTRTGTRPPKDIMLMKSNFTTWVNKMIGQSCAGKKCPHYGHTMIEHNGRLVCPLHNLMSDEKQEKIEGVCTYH